MNFLPDTLVTWWQSLPFTFPLGLLLLILVPLAFLVLLLRRQQMNVGSLLLFRDLPQRTLFQNLNLEHLWHRWIYAVIFIVLALIAAGLSLPQPGQRHLVVLDDSASMAAQFDALRPDQGTLWDRAKSQAARTAEQSSALGRAVVLLRLSDLGPIEGQADRDGNASNGVNNDNPAFVGGDENNLTQQLAALETAEPRPIPVENLKRIEALGALAGSQGFGRVTLFTDRPLAPDAPLANTVTWVDVAQGQPAINLAISQVQEKGGSFDRPSQVVIQNLSSVPVSDVELSVRSIKNPVQLPLVTGLQLAPNESLSFDIGSLRSRSEVLGAGPLQLSVRHPADALALDNNVWLVRPANDPIRVALVQCRGRAPLLERFLGIEEIQFSNFGDVTALAEATANQDIDPAMNDALDEDGNPVFSLGEAGIDAQGGRFESFDLVIYDRCEISPLYEELEANSIVIETVPNTTLALDSIGQSDAEAIARVNWQAPESRSPLLRGVRSLVGMPLVSQAVRPLPDTHRVVGLLSDLDPATTAGQAEQDFFAPTDLLQAFVAWDGLKTKFDFDGSTEIETALPADPDAPKMLYLGFDPHLACVNDAVNSRQQDIPLAEALAASQNGPDDCLAMSLLIVNSIEWMAENAVSGAPDDAGRIRQYYSTGESLNIRSTEGDQATAQNRERLTAIDVVQGQSGAERTPWQALQIGEIDAEQAGGAQVRWLLNDDGLFEYRGTQPPFDLSVGLFDADESRLDRTPLNIAPQVVGAAAGAGRQDLVRILLLLLCGLMLVEVVILIVRQRAVFGQRPSQRKAP